ncbi:MAG: hypothetical protein AAF497_02195 [Planctomycetota bacterium]
MLRRIRELRFTLRLLLGIILIFGMASAYVRHRIKSSAKTGELIQVLNSYPGRIELSYGWDDSSKPVTPEWARRYVGDYFFANVNGICLRGNENIDDKVIGSVGKFKTLRRFTVSFTSVTDDGLRNFQGLKRLEMLSLTGAPVTDKGMDIIGEMRQLRVLGLCKTNITDKGLKKLHGLDQLEAIVLTKTKTTKAGRDALRAALPNCRINYK